MLGERDQVATIVYESTLPYENLLQTLTLGILVLSKHDYAEEKHGESFSDAQLAECDRFTSAALARFQEQANQMLVQFVVSVSASTEEVARPKSLVSLVRDWLWGFGQAYAGAVAWSITLVGIALMTRYWGGDLIDIFRSWIKPQ